MRILLSIFFLSFLIASTLLALDGPVEFRGSTLNGLIKFTGEGAKAEGGEYKDGVISGTFKCDLTKFSTDDEKRDRDMHKTYLETDKFPEAVLVMEPTKGPDFKGKLTLHGMEKDVTGKISIHESEKKATAELEINFTEFGIKQPSLMGVKVDAKIPINVSLSL